MSRKKKKIIDPTKNVTAVLEAAVKRIDDLRNINRELVDSKVDHLKEMADIRAEYDSRLREAESKRIDAIRAVDVAAVASTARDAAIVASTLAGQVSTSADTLRSQVELTKTAAAAALATALQPIQRDVSELRDNQFKLAGLKQGSSESTESRRASVGQMIALVALIITPVSGIIIAIIVRH